MKGLRYLHLSLFLLFIAGTLKAQEFKTTVENSKEVKLALKDFTGDLPVEGYSGNEIIVTRTSDRSNSTPDRAKGLEAIYTSGRDNTGIGVSMEKNGNQITIQYLLPMTQHGGGYKIKVPDNLSLKVISGCERQSAVTIENMKNEFEVNICQAIKIKNSTGPLVLSNIVGDIDVVFNEVNKDKPVSIASVSGQIDVTLPDGTPVDLEMKTLTGTMYSTFDFPSDDKQMKRVGGSSVSYHPNGGGLSLKLTTISGNIYLRKK
jgi:lia operon protein LiaG